MSEQRTAIPLSTPEGCPIGDTTCNGWPADCPEPMFCAVDHLFSSLDLNSKQAVVVTQHPYRAAPQNGSHAGVNEEDDS